MATISFNMQSVVQNQIRSPKKSKNKDREKTTIASHALLNFTTESTQWQ